MLEGKTKKKKNMKCQQNKRGVIYMAEKQKKILLFSV